MLNVHDDVEVVEQDPAAFPLTLTAHGPGPGLAQPVLDLVHDRPHLAVVGGGTEQEHVGDDELLAHVVGDDVTGELVRRSLCGDPRKLDGPAGSSHVCCSSSSDEPDPTSPI